MRQRIMRARLGAQDGFTTVVLLGALLIGSLLVTAAFTAAQGDTGPARRDQFYKQAYAAAEAGVSYYGAHLVQDPDYWKKCYDPSATPTSAANTATQVWPQGTAFSTTTSRQVPNSIARYQIELLKPPQSGAPTTCSAANSASAIDPTTGQLTIRSTGSYQGVRRSIVATFKQPGFLQYLWFTDFETPDPTAAGTSSSCAKYARDGRSSSCGDQNFVSGDAINGPLHTNDVLRICGTPSFGRVGKSDSIETTDPIGAKKSTSSGCSLSPTWNGTTSWGAPLLAVPASNGSLSNYASADGAGTTCAASTAACWLFPGPVHVTLQTGGVRVVSSTGTVLKSGTGTYPPNGVLYVKNNGGTCDFDTNQSYPANNNCGDAWVSGTADKDLTVAAANDVIIDGDVKHSATSVVGLIANGFVRIYHPCLATTTTTYDYRGRPNGTTTTYSNGTTSPEDPGIGSLTNPTINAAVLALTHAFMVDNYDCGDPLGSLTVTGALAQKFRGTVGTGSPTIASGYYKSYTYDSSAQVSPAAVLPAAGAGCLGSLLPDRPGPVALGRLPRDRGKTAPMQRASRRRKFRVAMPITGTRHVFYRYRQDRDQAPVARPQALGRTAASISHAPGGPCEDARPSLR